MNVFTFSSNVCVYIVILVYICVYMYVRIYINMNYCIYTCVYVNLFTKFVFSRFQNPLIMLANFHLASLLS